MHFREALLSDIDEIQKVRNLVKENKLSDPGVISDESCAVFLTERGKGWVCTVDKQVVGFSIIDLRDHNVWALFLRPEFEGLGIGRKLHAMALNWYFEQSKTPLWLSTAPQTRAEQFYRTAGLTEVGMHGNELKFEMHAEMWGELRT